MSVLAVRMDVLEALMGRPSRSSAAAIGRQFVLSSSPPEARIRGLNALSGMVCDWSVAILEEAINDPSRGYLVRRYALTRLCGLVRKAIDQGYTGLIRSECDQLEFRAVMALSAEDGETGRNENLPAEDLCCHLAEAVAAGLFGELPDF